MKPQGVINVCRNLINLSNLTSLLLEFGDFLPIDCIQKVANSLEVLHRLKKLCLNFSKGNLNEKGCSFIVNSLERQGKLETLRLDFSNGFPDEDCIQTLAEYLYQAHGLEKIELKVKKYSFDND